MMSFMAEITTASVKVLRNSNLVRLTHVSDENELKLTYSSPSSFALTPYKRSPNLFTRLVVPSQIHW